MTSNHIKNNILLKRMNSVRVQGVIRKSILTVEKVRVLVDANCCMIEALYNSHCEATESANSSLVFFVECQ
jgi:hypothetical protein